jgi:1-deoxy-D-xylulose-5-phosphate synthase
MIKPTWVSLKEGQDIHLISYGPSLDLLMRASDELNINSHIINARFIKPVDEEMLHQVMKTGKPVLVYEEAANTGSLYPQILSFMAKHHYTNRIKEMSITDKIVDHGYYQDMLKELHMDLESVKEAIKELIHET